VKGCGLSVYSERMGSESADFCATMVAKNREKLSNDIQAWMYEGYM